MSIEAFRWAKEQDLPGLQKSVLIYLADRFNDAVGYAWPSIGRMAKETGWSHRSVSNAIRYLKDSGYIEVRNQFYVRDHSLGPNRYYIPAMGRLIPKPGTKFPIHGDFDFDGTWNESLEAFD